jgi:hypothetical protein
MRIYWLSEKKRKEATRELTDEEKEIAFSFGAIGFFAGMSFVAIFFCIVRYIRIIG